MRESLTPGVWGVVATPFQGSALDVDTDSLAGLVGLRVDRRHRDSRSWACSARPRP